MADDIKRGQTYVVYAIFAVHHGGNRHCGVNAAEQAFADMTYRNSDRIERRALALDNSAAGFADIGFNFRMVKRRIKALAIGNGVLIIVDRNV